MSKVFIEESTLSSIGNAIRAKTGKSELINPANMPTEISSITTGGSGADENEIISKFVTGESFSGEFINNEIEYIRYGAFAQTHITKVDCPKVEVINGYAFNDCTKLTSINFPKVIQMNGHCFSYCTSLIEAKFQSPISIEAYIFYNASKLQKCDFNVITIYMNTFASSALDTLILRRTEKITYLNSKGAFANTPIAKGTGYIYVPAALIDEYKTATNWVTFASQFRAIEDYPDICGEATE